MNGQPMLLLIKHGFFTDLSAEWQFVGLTKSQPDREKDAFESNLYLPHLNKQKNGSYEIVQITRGSESDYSPLFSKDGETIYFLSSCDEGKKL